MTEKLIICSPQLGISPQSDLGGEVYDREMIKALCDLGVQVIVILPKNKAYLSHKNLKVYFLPFPFVWPPFLFNFLIIPWLFWIYKKEKFNILRIHSPYFVGLGAWFFKLFKPKINLTAHYHHLELKKRLFYFLDRLLIKKWDSIIADSQFTKEEIIFHYQIEPKKIKLVYPGIEKKFKPQNKNKKLVQKYQLQNTKVLLYLGGLKPRKNIDFLIELMNQFKLEKVKLLICGKGSLSNQLKNKVKELNLEMKVIFLDFIPEKEKVNYYNLTDIFVLPSQKEGFGLVLLEAAACKVPSVASNTSSLKELIINGETGYLARLNDVNDWILKIKKLLKDNQLRKKMSRSARKFSQKFSWQQSVKKQIKIYQL